MDKNNIIKYVKIGVFIGGSFLLIRFVIKQIKLKKFNKMFGNFKTITDNNKGNTGGVTLPKDSQSNSWSPRASAEAVRDSMKGWGTDETKLFNTLDALNSEQLVQVRSYFNTYFADGDTLFQWFEDDLGSSDVSRAKGYFTG